MGGHVAKAQVSNMLDQMAGPLGAYRVVELEGATSLPLGRMLADLGADVIKVEPPGGDPSRALPPLIQDRTDSEASLFWLAYALGKRSVTANLSVAGGCELVRCLIRSADVLLESFTPGTLESHRLGYEQLRQENPRLIMTSLTPFGQTGPYASWHGSDLVHFAMGGYLYMTGAADGRPVKPSAPYQSWLHGSMHALAATLLALRQRQRTGRGAHVDQALRDTGPWMLTHTYQFYDLAGINLKRQGTARDVGRAVRLRSVFACRDGYIVWMFTTGHIGGAGVRALVKWMTDEAMAPVWLQALDWSSFDLLRAGSGKVAELDAAFSAFFATKTKAELFDWALSHRVMLAPVQSLHEVAQDPQLAAREAWRLVDADGASACLRVPGPPVRLGSGGWEAQGSAPGVGAQNSEIYGDELGCSASELAALRADHII